MNKKLGYLRSEEKNTRDRVRKLFITLERGIDEYVNIVII